MTVLIGTSGWQYKHWRERYYPRPVPQNAWLSLYCEDFRTVEVNNTFYRLPERATFEKWRENTQKDFVFAVKASRYLTHIKRLRDTGEAVDRFVEASAGLGDKLGPVLLQLPPSLQANPQALKQTLRRFPESIKLAVEFRHASWFCQETRRVLEKTGAALCLADRNSRPASPLWKTAGWGYLRFHSGAASPRPCYGRQALDSWADRLAGLWGPDADLYVFFNNDTAGCALRDAGLFARAAAARGLTTSRVADPRTIRVG